MNYILIFSRMLEFRNGLKSKAQMAKGQGASTHLSYSTTGIFFSQVLKAL